MEPEPKTQPAKQPKNMVSHDGCSCPVCKCSCPYESLMCLTKQLTATGVGNEFAAKTAADFIVGTHDV